MTLTPRPREPEFADTETDRAALAAVLTAAGQEAAPDGDLAEMNVRWDKLSYALFSAQPEAFDRWAEALHAATAKADKPVRQRISELEGHLVGWRIGDV
ncbi:hypothetical protein [Brevundimonas sp. GCM10030266]|uniref:hypothetical protein n=1 Tax=Brevundimonas sp. GCM10030266 TaxID=3273386 RepID=UPI00360ED70F